ncbi:SPV146 G protein-coupled CC chemokine receptor-like protein [Swinepox virus]|uniref:SPV146 G protein-coupled CC chemokine receptor-like protein n=2 Tax=Swinepox virus (strain Swine/Nebraska/17077-99/1999) TaxID=300880 RepID=Q8V3F0_SWPV1|nr:SPV146 G protein-coupled CC chemokine receptor-like protein [Swinepox virus]AAL69885.1 SPV146 G protein-coupled CC chemokine receptor-like protein [Swinepox virus]UED36578.1 SPV146 G protein-coupled CC chemokine receptor-like protein [Swinepox virus]UED36727.1 SPV146 G protein-coupled CC chemokine receptor-like protein [Swinepox virus]UUA44336.1 SPV146 [Swinepox virus]
MTSPTNSTMLTYTTNNYYYDDYYEYSTITDYYNTINNDITSSSVIKAFDNNCTFLEDTKYHIIVIHIILFLLGSIGNIFVVSLIAFKRNKSITDIYILNLSMSDCIFVFQIPFIVYSKLDQWIFGNILCKIMSVLYYVGFFSNMFIITLMSIDRYFAIVHPIKRQPYRTKRIGILMCCSAWLLSLILSSPVSKLYENIPHMSKDIYQCTLTNENDSIIAFIKRLMQIEITILGFLIPIIIFVYCYYRIFTTVVRLRNRRKYKSIKIVLMIVVCSLICWIPLYIVLMIATIVSLYTSNIFRHLCLYLNLAYAITFSETISLARCCINPIIYTLIGEHVRSRISSICSCIYRDNTIRKKLFSRKSSSSSNII